MMKYLRYIFMLGAFLFLAHYASEYARHQAYGYYRNPFWADKAGYYVYLPYIFQNGGEAGVLNDSIALKTGDGFLIEDDKIVTKYPIGVALMEAPFYVLASLENQLHEAPNQNHFQNPFTKWLVLAAPFYVVIGLFLLYMSLRLLDVPTMLSIGVLAFSVLGTSVYYYTVIEGTMSHSFSFALFGAFTFVWLRILYGSSQNKWAVFLAIIVGLIVLVRPFNVLLVVVYGLSIGMVSEKKLMPALQYLLKKAWLIIPLFALICLPQLIYYKHVFGTWLTYSYGDEGFNFLEPHLRDMFLSAPAGLFVYVPAFVLFFFAVFWQGARQPKKYGAMAIFLLLVTYLLASWHSWSFGCGFGIRTYVEWVPLLIFPFAQFLRQLPKTPLILVVSLMGILVFYNLSMSYKWTGCWFGKDYSYAEFIRMFWS